MARDLCLQCQRPCKACICDFSININNKLPVLVLQHPSEVKQAKGTVVLLNHSLDNCQVLVGENFTDHAKLNEIISLHQPLLLYPSKLAKPLVCLGKDIKSESADTNLARKTPLLIILDGTWKKAYRMFMLSKNLHSLTQVCLPQYLANKGQYLIRKVAKKNALSSLEATCYALALLEGEITAPLLDSAFNENNSQIDCGRYQALLNKFSQFNQFQLSFRK